MANGSSGSSSAIRAWKTTWSRTSPSSSRSSSRSPSSIASTSSYASSMAYLARPRCVFCEVQGHSRLIRSMTWTRSRSRAPGRSYEPGSSSRSGIATRPEPPRRASPSVSGRLPSPPTSTTTLRPPAQSSTSSPAVGSACSTVTPASRRYGSCGWAGSAQSTRSAACSVCQAGQDSSPGATRWLAVSRTMRPGSPGASAFTPRTYPGPRTAQAPAWASFGSNSVIWVIQGALNSPS